MRDEHGSGVCSQIDENTIELHAMGRLQENSIRQHLDSCDVCKGRVVDHRSWIEDLKRGLREFQQAEHSSGSEQRTQNASPQDGS